jgi:predicted ATP-dependent protease
MAIKGKTEELLSTEPRERILKAVREKKQINTKANPSKSQQMSQQKP